MAETSTRARRDSGDLSALLLPELKKIAANLGIEGASDMKKPDLVQAISDLQAANREAARLEREARRSARMARRSRNSSDDDSDSDEGDDGEETVNQTETDNSSSQDSNSSSRDDRGYDRGGDRGGDRDFRRDRHRDRGDRGRDRHRDRGDRGDRGREREITISEDDVLLPVGGLLDILENYAFIRTGGYLPGPNDVYVSLHQVRRYGLRKGDVVTGQVRQPREGERREKFNALVRVDTVNGMDPETSKDRIEFSKLVPLYPQERLRLETEPNILTTRVIDLISPIG
ncbi:MAG: Rho termination factor N-terminal domain-containing protein, partial [Actinomycetota bacterium]